MGLDAYTQDDEDAQPETDSTEPSGTYIEFNSRDHTRAWKLVKGGGTIRDTFPALGVDSHHDFYAELTEALGYAFEEGNHVPVLEFIDPSVEEVREFLEQKKKNDE